MDYCEIILDSVHKIVTAEMAKELKGLSGVLVTAQVLENKSNDTYIVQESGGRKISAKADKELVLAINDYVYLNDTTIVAKKLDNSQVPIEINESLKDFISFQKGNKELALINPRVYNRLLLTAKINLDVTKDSNYNISIKVTNNEGRIYELGFTQKDLIGRIGFLGGSLQKQMYSLDIGIVTGVKAVFDSDTYSSVELALGSNAEGLKDEIGLKLFSTESELEYKTDTKGQVINEKEFPIQWTWIYTDDKAILHFESFKENPERIIKYYRYNELYNKGDEYGGLNWEAIEVFNNTINYTNLLSQPDITRIKAVIVNGQEIITSNELEFKNTKLTREGIISNMALKFSDSRNGRYPLYSPSGVLLDEYIGEACKEKQVTFTFVNTDENQDINSLIEKVIWMVDLDKIQLSQSILNDITVRNSTAELDSLGNLIVSIDTTNRTKEIEIEQEDGSKKIETISNWQNLEFFIKDSIDLQSGYEDLITCTVRLKGDDEPYIASANLVFTTDTFGDSNYAIFTDLKEQNTDNVVQAAKWTKNYELVVSVYDKDGNLVNFEINGVDWYGNSSVLGSSSRCFKTPELSGNSIWIESANKGDEWKDPYHVLKVSHIIKFNVVIRTETNPENTYTIPYLYPLSILFGDTNGGSAPLENWTYKGPKKIVYNAAGVPKAGTTWDIEIIDLSTKAEIEEDRFFVSTTTWGGSPTNYRARNTKNEGEIEGHEEIPAGYWFPAVEKTRNGKYKIIASNIYDSSIDTYGTSKYLYNLYWKKGGTAFYQPILIYKDVEFSSYISDWNGGLTIDEQQNAVLAASMVAGSKDTDNKFTGVVIGDISNISNVDGYATSGILGFNKNTQVFSLSNEGKATFGKSGSGQIIIDGNQGIIQSGGYDGTLVDGHFARSGMMINLDADVEGGGRSGEIRSKNFAIAPDGSAYFRGRLEVGSSIGGAKVDNDGSLILAEELNKNLVLDGHYGRTAKEGERHFAQFSLVPLSNLTPGTYTLTARGKLGSKATSGYVLQVSLYFSTPTTSWKRSITMTTRQTNNTTLTSTFTLTKEELEEYNHYGLSAYYLIKDSQSSDNNGAETSISWVSLTKNDTVVDRFYKHINYMYNINNNLIKSSAAAGNGEITEAEGCIYEHYKKVDTSSTFIGGQKYTIQIKGKLPENYRFMIRTYKGSWKGEVTNNDRFKDTDIFIYTLKWPTTKPSDDPSDWNTGITIQSTGVDGDRSKQCYIEWVKVEEGTIPTYYDEAIARGDLTIEEVEKNKKDVDKANDILNNWSYTDKTQTIIDGGNIETGNIRADKIAVDYIKSSNCEKVSYTGYTDEAGGKGGTFMNLTTGAIHSKNFYIDSAGNANFRGIITAKAGGEIAGWSIGENTLNHGSFTNGPIPTDYLSLRTADYTGNISIGGSPNKSDWRLVLGPNFGVDKTGNLYCNGGKIGGLEIINGVLSLSSGTSIEQGINNANKKWKSTTTIDLTSNWNKRLWFPVVLEQTLSSNYLSTIEIVLNGTYPDAGWGRESDGLMTADFLVEMRGSGWGQTDGETFIYNDMYKHIRQSSIDGYTTSVQSPISIKQLTQKSYPIVYLRGGAKYTIYTDFALNSGAAWTPYADLIETDKYGYKWVSGQHSETFLVASERPVPRGQYKVDRSELTVLKKEISATVTEEVSGKLDAEGGRTSSTSKGTSWSLKADGFRIYAHTGSKKTEVLTVNENGLSVTGKITATSGYIGNASSGLSISSMGLIGPYSTFTEESKTGSFLTGGAKNIVATFYGKVSRTVEISSDIASIYDIKIIFVGDQTELTTKIIPKGSTGSVSYTFPERYHTHIISVQGQEVSQSIKLYIKNTISISNTITGSGFSGIYSYKTYPSSLTTYAKLKQLYIDNLGQLCILEN